MFYVFSSIFVYNFNIKQKFSKLRSVEADVWMEAIDSPQRTISRPPTTGSGIIMRTAIHLPIREATIMTTALISTTRRLATYADHTQSQPYRPQMHSRDIRWLTGMSDDWQSQPTFFGNKISQHKSVMCHAKPGRFCQPCSILNEKICWLFVYQSTNCVYFTMMIVYNKR